MNDLDNIDVKKIELNKLETIIKIPKFQRHLVWKDNDKKELLKSIMSQKPIGTLIVWKTDNEQYLIDGMQRFSTIKLLRDKFYYYVDFEWLIDFYQQKSKTNNYDNYKKNIKIFAKEYQAFLKKFKTNEKNSTFIKELNNLFKYDFEKSSLSEEFKNLYYDYSNEIRVISKIFRELKWDEQKLNNYNFICIFWKSKDEEEVIDGFDKLNSKGKKLSNYDLLFAKWSANLQTIKWELKTKEKDLIKLLYQEVELDEKVMPKVDENKLTCPEIIWLMMQKGEILENYKQNLLANILKGLTKNEQIYLFSFLLIFVFAKINEDNSKNNKSNDVNDELEELKNNIEKYHKEKILNLVENLKIINYKITKKIKFIHTPNKDEARRINKHKVNKYGFLIIYGIVISILRKDIFEKQETFLNSFENNIVINKLFKRLDYEILQILFSAKLSSNTNKHSYDYVKKRTTELNDINWSLDEEWNNFQQELDLILSKNNTKDNFPNFFAIIQLVNSYIIDEHKDEFRGYHLDHLIPKKHLKAMNIEQISNLGNLSILRAINNIRKNDEINENYFKHDYINKNIKEKDNFLYQKLVDKYNSLLKLKSKNSYYKFARFYQEIVDERKKWILKYFEKNYLKI